MSRLLASTDPASRLELQRVLGSLDRRPTVAAYAQTAREVRELAASLPTARVGLLATFTIDSLVPYLEVEAARAGFAADIYVGPFNAIRQELLDPQGGCHCHHPDIVFLAQLLEDVCPPLASDFLSLEGRQVEKHIDEVASDLQATLMAFRRHSQAAVVVHNFPLPSAPLLGIYEASAETSQTAAIRLLNSRLAEAVKAIQGTYLLDFDRLCADLGYRNWRDDKMWLLGRAPLSARTMPALARTQATFLCALLGSPRKCLVLDLDNTLWGGVVGEDGVAGIELGSSYPGNAFCEVQRAVLRLYHRGVVLAINSKNNKADVEEAFRTHPDMVLRPEHFAATRINWRGKPENMLEIADELNIALESLVFLDDNPAECELMRQSLPEVLTLEAYNGNGDPNPLRSARLLLEGGVFDRVSFTSEDRRRGELYQQQAARRWLQRSATSVEEFLSSLEMTASIREVDEFAFPRVLELIHKTNQFNLTTRRHSAARLAEMAADPHCGVFALRAGDRFGDSGIVGAAVVNLQDKVAAVDTFLLSCRVIGRTLETAFLWYLADWARRRDANRMEGEFILTRKNAPAADFFARHGFSEADDSTGGNGSRWRLLLDEIPFQWPGYIELIGKKKGGQ